MSDENENVEAIEEETPEVEAPRELTEEERAKLQELDEALAKFEGQKRWTDVIRTLLAQAEIHVDPETKIELFRKAGSMYVERSSNQAEAIKCFEKLLALSPYDRDALTRLKEMYEKRRDWEKLIRTMMKEAELLDLDEQPLRYAEMAELATKRIRKPDICIELWERVRAAEPTHPEALEALSQLYERARKWEPLAEILEILTDADPDPKALQKLGMIYADKVGDDAGAVRAFRKLLDINPDDRRAAEQLKRRYVALKAWDDLEEFYGQSEKWDELIRIFETAQEDKVELLFRAAALWIEKKGKPERAARAYEKILDIDENNLAAAEALSPIYEEANDARKLAPVYEVRLRHDMEPDSQVALLRELGLLYEEKLRRPDTAFQKYLEAFLVMPLQETVREDVERLAEATDDWERVIQTYQQAIESAEAEDDANELRIGLGRVLTRVERVEDAIEQFYAVFQSEEDNTDAIAALSDLYQQTGKHSELQDIYERRIVLENDPEVRREISYRRAALLDEQLGKPTEAIEAYTDILGEYGFGEVEAFRALDRLYEAEERWQDLAETLERRIELAESHEEIAAHKFRLGRVLDQFLEEKSRAVELYREVLTILPEHDGGRQALEGLLDNQEVGSAAARILEPIYEVQEQWEALIRVLRVLHQEAEQDEKLGLLAKIGKIYGEELGDADQAFAAYAEVLREQPSSDQALSRLETLSIAQERFPQLVELLTSIAGSCDDLDLRRILWIKSAVIYDSELEDVDSAVGAYRKVLDDDPGDEEVLLALDSLFRRTERWDELAMVLRRRAEQSTEPEDRESLLLQMANIHDEFLEDPTTAIAIHNEILDVDPMSARALAALDHLFERQEMWAELADNVDRQLELAVEDDRQIELMLRSAELRETKMNATEAAIEIYHEVLDREPLNESALAHLERLIKNPDYQVGIAEILEPIYRDSGQIPKLIGIHEIQAQHATSSERRIELFHNIAELYEIALDDYASAFQSYARALAEDPANTVTQEHLERLTPAIGDAEALAKTFEKQVEEVDDPFLAASLHVKAAQIREHQLSDNEGAIAHYQKVLELDEQHLEAATALERLYQLSERYEELATIYQAKSRMLMSPDEQKDYLYRAAMIYEELLERPQDAALVYHQALEIDPEDLQSLNRLIELNLRLEKWEKLLELYTHKADIVDDPDEKKDLYAEVGTVFERELKDHDKAIDSYQRILEIDPGDLNALQRLDQLYQTTENWEELLSVLERESDLATDANEVISYRYRIGELWQHHLQDTVRAIDIYREILEVAPEHEPTILALESIIAAGAEPLPAAEVLEPIYRQLAQWPELIRIHEVQITHEEDPLRKVELLHQVAELFQVQLGDAQSSFEAFARALPFENHNEHTLSSLEQLAELTNGWAEVCRLYDVEIKKIREEHPDDVIDMALRAAMIYEVQIEDVDSAIERYRLIVDTDPVHVRALESLDRLYEAKERWSDLAEILQKEVDVAASPDDILTLQYRLGQLYEKHLGKVDNAISEYQEILAAAPEYVPAMDALESLFAQGVKPLRIGEIIEPLYRMQESWDRLLNVHEIQLSHQPDAIERVVMMHRIAEIAEERAADHQRAFLWMQRALLEDPWHDHSLGEVERLGSILDGWLQLANTYADTIEQAQDIELKGMLTKRLARVYEEELSDVVRAEETYRFALGVRETDEESLEALDRIYVEHGAHEALSSILQKRIVAADVPADLVDLHFRLGQVLENDLGQTERAIQVYSKVLEDLEPEHEESMAALQEIYTRKQDWKALFSVFEKEIDVVFGDTNRADITAKMAHLASSKLNDDDLSISLWKKVLDLRGEDPEALNALGNIYAEQENWAELVEVLEREVNVADDDMLRIHIYNDLGSIWYEKLERDRNAIDNYERVLDIDPGNTDALFRISEIHRAGNQIHELVDTFHRIIDVGAATLEEAQLESVYMQLGHLYGEELQQPMDAVDAYNRAIEANPRNFDAMDALEHIHYTEGMWEDVIGVMEKRAVAFDEPGEKIEQFLVIAKTWAEQCDHVDGGTSAYQKILEIDPLHDYAFQQLEVLHREAERWEELIDMYIVRFETTEDTSQNVRLLRKVAKVYEEHLGDNEEAFDALQIAWSLDYSDKDAFEELTRMARLFGKPQEQGSKWKGLLETIHQALQENQDQETQVTLCLQCAKWYGQELDSPDYALPYYQQVQAVDPTNVNLMLSIAELYEKTEQWDALNQTYQRIVSSTSDREIQSEIYVKMGRLAQTHLGEGNKAGGYFEKALEASPQSIDAIEALEHIYAERGDWVNLIDVLSQKTIALDEPEAVIDARLKLAEVYEDRTQDVDMAIQTYNEVRGDDAYNLFALRGLERLFGRTERWQDLLHILEEQYDVVSTEKERVEILLQLAGIWEEQFIKPERATERLEQLLEIDPMHHDALSSLGRLYRQLQNWDSLIDTYERHIAATPDRAEKIRLYKALGRTYVEDVDDADRAVDAYLNVLSIDEDEIEALDALTRVYDKRGDHVSALEMMDQLIRLIEDPTQQVDLLFRSGRILDNELGDRIAALEKYQMATDLDPGHLPSLAAMRAIQLDSGDWLAAAKLIEREASYQENPRIISQLLVELGQLYDERLEEHEQAIQVWEAAYRQDPDNEDAALPLVDEYTGKERYEEAFPLLEMLVKRSGKREPDEQHRLAFQLGETASELGRVQESIKAFEKAYQIDATHLPTLIGVAGAYYTANDWAQAFKFYQMLLVHHRDSLGVDEITDIFYRLGVIKGQQGERRKALNMFDKALEEDPYHRPTLEAITSLYEEQSEWQQVIHFKRQTLELEDDLDKRFAFLDEIGTLWKEKIGHSQKAIEAWSEASGVFPDNHIMLHKLLGAYQETKQWDEAIEIIEQIASLDDRKDRKAKYAYTVAVITRDELKDPDTALEKFDIALDHDPDQLKAFEAINKILNAKKDWKALERAYRKMIHRIIQEPDRDELKYNLFYTLGIVYRDRQQNFDAAAEAFRTAASLREEDPQQHQILAELYTRMPDKIDLAIEEYQWLVRNDPHRVDSYHALYKLYFDAREYDKAWCLAATLNYLQKANKEQQQFHTQYKPQGPIRPRGRMDRNLWFNELTHPEQDRYVSKIMELMAPAALSVKQSTDKALNIHRLKPEDTANSTVTFVRTFGFVQQVLNVPTQPRLFLQQQSPGGLSHLPGSNPPAAIAGSTLLSGYTPQDLMFVAGRFLTYYLSEHFVRTLFNSHTELRMLLLAALRLSGMGPADPNVDQWVAQLTPHMNPAQLDGLRAVCRKFIDEREGRADIKYWIQMVELSAIRAGLLVSNDLEVARRMIPLLAPGGAIDLPPKEKIKELVLFSVSEKYFRLRKALGIQIQV